MPAIRIRREADSSRIGIDLGGTKIEGVLLDSGGAETARRRIAAPRGDYAATITAVTALVHELETEAGLLEVATGIGIPGSVSRRTGLVHNANSTWLNGRDLARDLERTLGRAVRIANDANCFALSEAIDGAGCGAETVLGVILGTGVGGGIVRSGEIVDGPLGIAGEWGHNSLPWPNQTEVPGPACWCGRSGCMETWISGPALAADHERLTGRKMAAEAISGSADAGDVMALAALDRHADRVARGIAHVVNVLDPDVIVLGGGLSNLRHLYGVLPELMRPHIFSDDVIVTVRPPVWGDASGVRGAAWLAEW